MNLNLKEKYKSLDPFVCDLPDFTILTGINGAGKTQILQGIADNRIIIDQGAYNGYIKYVNNNILSPTDAATITSQDLNNKKQEIWNQLSAFKTSFATNPNYTVVQFLNQWSLDIVNEIALIVNKKPEVLEREDIYKHYPIDDGQSNSEIFYHVFSNLFKRYKDKYIENKFNKFLNEQEGHDSSVFLTDSQFVDKWGEAPWDFLNRLNEEAGLNFVVNTPIDGNTDIPFELTLKDRTSGENIKFNELSSGEKAIMSLALALYNLNIEKKFPKVLLMDEADSSLHPSMTKHFLRVIENFFVRERSIKVILSTHSPSTVALAEDTAIYVVSKYGSPRIHKASKDSALKVLTDGVPSFSVNYENRRQVFVESSYDVLFYEKIYQLLSAKLNPEISLTFISSGDSRKDKNGIPVSSCDQVIHISDTLRKAGNRFISGIIDFDGKNESSTYIKTLGDGERYSIENYLFDPLLISCLLFREKIITRPDIGLSEDENIPDIKSFSSERLQIIADYSIKKIAEVIQSQDDSVSKVITVDSRAIVIPNWYLQYQGHQLEEMILKTFPALNAIKKGSETALKLAVIDKVMDDVPSIIPLDFLNTFMFAQEA